MIYNYKVKDNKDEMIDLSIYKGKVLLIVNSATRCGLTKQYDGLQSLYAEYKEQGFEILEFPCNQFLEQAPESDDEIESFCTLTYATTFKRFAKIDVNGENADPLYKYIRSEVPNAEENLEAKAFHALLALKGIKAAGDEIIWNFTKFLIDREGNVVKRFDPTVKPKKLNEDISKLLK